MVENLIVLPLKNHVLKIFLFMSFQHQEQHSKMELLRGKNSHFKKNYV
jgi:hypothetical protein